MQIKKVPYLLVVSTILFFSLSSYAAWEQVDQQINQDNQYISVGAYMDNYAAAGGILSQNGQTSPYSSYTTNGTTFNPSQFGDGGGGGGMMDMPAIPGMMTLASKKTGFAYDLFSGTVMKTTNGGSSWAEETIPFETGIMANTKWGDIHAVDSGTAWMVGAEGLMMRIGYGASGWEDVNWFRNEFGNVKLIDVTFANKARGYALSRGEDETQTTVYYTRNGGGVWEKLSVVDSELWKLSFGSCDTIYAGGSKNDMGCIYKSTDGGVSWAENCDLPEMEMQNPLNGEIIKEKQKWVGDMVMYDENTGWAMAHYNDCEDCDPEVDEGCEACDMSKDTTSMLMTADGGATWYRDQTFDPTGGSMMGARGFYAMDCGTMNTCYVAGYYLTIMRWTRDTPVEDDGSWKTRECDATSIPDAGTTDDDDNDTVAPDDDDDTGAADDDDNNDTTNGGETDDDDTYDSEGRTMQNSDEEDGGCGCRIR